MKCGGIAAFNLFIYEISLSFPTYYNKKQNNARGLS
jgi:hypothetical protein